MTVRQKNRLKKRAFGWGMSILRTVFIGGLCFVVLYPLLTMLTSSVMSVSDIYDSSVNYIPKAFTLEHYGNAAKMLGWLVINCAEGDNAKPMEQIHRELMKELAGEINLYV